MSVRRLRPLTASALAKLPESCSSCPVAGVRAEAWATAAVDRFGLCGVAAMDADEVIGWLLVSPALNLNNAHPLAAAPRNPDAALLVQVRVLPAYRGIGIGRQLVQSVAGRLVGRASSIEAIGVDGAGSCAQPPLGWLEAVGFTLVEPDADRPAAELAGVGVRVRLDLSTTVRWKPDLLGALERLTGWARPAPAPYPAPNARAQSSARVSNGVRHT